MINYLYAKFFYRFYSKDFDKDRAKKILNNLRMRSKNLVGKTPEEIVSALSKEFPGWDVPKYPNDGKQFNWSFVLDEKKNYEEPYEVNIILDPDKVKSYLILFFKEEYEGLKLIMDEYGEGAWLFLEYPPPINKQGKWCIRFSKFLISEGSAR